MHNFPPLLIVPGLGDSPAGHWQDQWRETLTGAHKVEQADWDAPRLEDWLDPLHRALDAHPGALVVGHSLGCALIVHAARTSCAEKIGGALLVAPADVDLPSPVRARLADFAPLPLATLPFPSIVAASKNDPYVSARRARLFAEAWGAQFVDLGLAGHVNIASGHGPWPEGIALLDRLRAQAGRTAARAA
ncbi:MAG: alpha/beta hydrolase [Pseudomonadota bacterium]|jgi:predicted alpha/beta hydrolase family esterase